MPFPQSVLAPVRACVVAPCANIAAANRAAGVLRKLRRFNSPGGIRVIGLSPRPNLLRTQQAYCTRNASRPASLKPEYTANHVAEFELIPLKALNVARNGPRLPDSI